MLQELITISRHFGNNPEYIIAGGGNTSCKDENTLWIKASGVSLKTIDQEGFVELSRTKLKILETKKYSDNSIAREQEVKADLYTAVISSDKRPSVETSLHNCIEYTYVVHTHPTRLNGLLCSIRAKELIYKLFGEDVLFVEYTDPGYTLFKKVLNEINNHKKKHKYCPKTILLENHGIFVAADTITEIMTIYESIEETVNGAIGYVKMDFNINQLSAQKITSLVNIPSLRNKAHLGFNGGLISHFLNQEANYKKISRPFTPDHIVYCRSNYLYIRDSSNANTIEDLMVQFRNRYGYDAKIIAIKNLGLIAADDSEKLAKNVFEVFFDMMKISYYAERFGGPKPMNERQIEFIDSWEVENYRRQMQGKANT